MAQKKRQMQMHMHTAAATMLRRQRTARIRHACSLTQSRSSPTQRLAVSGPCPRGHTTGRPLSCSIRRSCRTSAGGDPTSTGFGCSASKVPGRRQPCPLSLGRSTMSITWQTLPWPPDLQTVLLQTQQVLGKSSAAVGRGLAAIRQRLSLTLRADLQRSL